MSSSVVISSCRAFQKIAEMAAGVRALSQMMKFGGDVVSER
jgi:hypothetical protein